MTQDFRSHIVLASASPRRSELLRQIGVAHRVQPAQVDVSLRPDEPPDAYVLRLAQAKAEALWRELPAEQRPPVLGADTAVAADHILFGKPRDRSDGLHMLAQLAGRTHRVYTAVALCSRDGLASRLSVSTVTFRALSAAEREAYWNSGEPRDKAGGYAIQGLAAAFITRIEGSYSGVMGLPLAETAELLSQIGWSLAGNKGAA